MLKRLKRVGALTALLGTTFTAGVYAEDIMKKVDAYLRPDFNVVVDGKQVKLNNPVLIYDSAGYMPLKELGNMLGANIIWREDNKTIYVNSRINPEQPTQEADPAMEEIKMNNPIGITVNYLGAEYNVLTIYAEKNTNKFWRLSDVKRMGIDTNGLKLVKEWYTQVPYVSEQELRKKWRQVPTNVNTKTGYIVNGDLNQKRIDLLQNYLKDTLSQKISDVYFYRKPIMIDALPDEEDAYEYLYYQDARFTNNTGNQKTGYRLFRAVLKLGKNVDGTYDRVNMTANTDLQDIGEKRDAEKASSSSTQQP